MRIGVVTTSYPRFFGDSAGNFVLELTQWIEKAGHEVEIIAADDRRVVASSQEASVVRVPVSPGLFYEGGAPDALSSFRRRVHAAHFSVRILTVLRKRARGYDGIVAHWLAPCGVAATIAAPNLPIWAIAHGGDVALLKKAHLSGGVARLLNRPNVHLNFVSRQTQRTFLEGAGRADALAIREHSTCLPMGIHLPASVRSVVGGKARGCTILFLGRLVPIKGLDVLLDALSRLEVPYTLIVAGAGPEQVSLQKLAEKLSVPVDWRGEVLTHERDELLANADLVVIPSRPSEGREEGMPVVALEALAAGVELLVSDTGGLSEIPGSICHRVPADNVPALRTAITSILNGEKAEFRPGHWLEERSWQQLAPRILVGLTRS